jgi:signal recognition particle receptor subunit beta
VVAINGFPHSSAFSADAVRDALAISRDTPVVHMDARRAESCTETLIVLVQHALSRSAVQAS